MQSLSSGRTGLAAVDAATGAERWFLAGGASSEAPVVANGVVYLPTRSAVRAVRAADGALVASLPYRTAAVIVAGGRLYVNESAPPAETTALSALAPPAG